MLEVCERFPAIGTIQNYLALPPGERVLYNQYVLLKITQEAQTPTIKINSQKGG